MSINEDNGISSFEVESEEEKDDPIMKKRLNQFLRFKDGRSYNEHHKEFIINKLNERKENELLGKIKEYALHTDLKSLRRLIKRNPEINEMDVRILNEDYPMKQYRFVKRNGLINVVHDLKRNPTLDSSNEFNTNCEMQNFHPVMLNENMINEPDNNYQLLDSKIEQLTNKLNELIDFINNELVEFINKAIIH